ncbi:MAG TPA: hypothetical protein VIY48_13440 [Candidatus Paceibacterota bacterium]
MTATDELVNKWFIERWTAGAGNMTGPCYDEKKHGPVAELQVITMDAGWDCYCYSEYTRDDVEVLTATVGTKSGDFNIRYGVYGSLPSILEDLIDFGNLEDICSVERDYAEDEY